MQLETLQPLPGPELVTTWNEGNVSGIQTGVRRALRISNASGPGRSREWGLERTARTATAPLRGAMLRPLIPHQTLAKRWKQVGAAQHGGRNQYELCAKLAGVAAEGGADGLTDPGEGVRRMHAPERRHLQLLMPSVLIVGMIFRHYRLWGNKRRVHFIKSSKPCGSLATKEEA